MKLKINTICFIFLFLFLISAVSAANIENETETNLQQPNPNQDLCKISIENDYEKLKISNDETEILKATSPTKTKEKVTITASNLKMYYKDGSKFKISLKDKNKKPIAKAKISFTINGKTYSKNTNGKGIAYLDINLKSGNYSILTKFAGTGKYSATSKKNTIDVKSTIKCSNFKKYYTNTAQYSSTFYNQKGNVLKNTAIKFKVNNKYYSVKTNKYGVAKLAINLKPGTYTIYSVNPKTAETVSKTLTVKSLIETDDLKINENCVGKFNVKVLSNTGKVSPNQKVKLTVNGKSYTKTTNKNGIATLDIHLKAGTYSISTEYSGLRNINKIYIKAIKLSKFTHTTSIPNYVNVTTDYVFNNSKYCLKSGSNGIIKMPKREVFEIEIGEKCYTFSTTSINGIDSIELKDKHSYLIPFDGSGIKINTGTTNPIGDGIIIAKFKDYTQITYQSKTKNNTALFGFYAGKGTDNSEKLTYMENENIIARVSFQTLSFDELGLKYTLSKQYGKPVSDFNYKSYEEITNNNTKSIKFADTGTAVTFSYFGKSIAGYISKEGIITKFKVDEKEELEKKESISYGLDKYYRKTLEFEVLQTYTIINEKITEDILDNWLSKSSTYLNRFGVMNVYGMHLASLEVAWLADAFADDYSKEFKVKWERSNTLTILGGINLQDTYLNILNADMGMKVTGNKNNTILFKLINSINLPNIEDYVLINVAERYFDKSSNSLSNMFSAVSKNNYSIAQLGDMIYIFSDVNGKSAIILNTTSGVSNVVLAQDSVYKGSAISTSKDCCSVGIMPKDIIAGIRNTFKFASPVKQLTEKFNKIHPLTKITYHLSVALLSKTLTGASAAGLGLLTAMAAIQTGGTIYKDGMVDEKDWHKVMDKYTFTRPGYLQSKKVYNIPNKKGGYDYIEVKIKGDMTLDRDSAIYISEGKTKQLSKSETYQYFTDEYWTPFSVPKKYWDESWKR